MTIRDHALITIHDHRTTCTIYQHCQGEPDGPDGVLAAMRSVCSVAGLDPGAQFARGLAARLVERWADGASMPPADPALWFDPRWWYELERVGASLFATVHDLETLGAMPRTIEITTTRED